VYDGSRHRLTPERATEIQEQLGADIAMVLDVCPGLPAEADVIRTAVTRTREWAARCRDAHHRRDQALFGIVQGGTDPDLRQAAARDIVGLGFDGYAVGGLSVGESRAEMLPALEAALSELPWGRTRYLMGVGDPVAIVEAVALGVDQFDCVLPTRLARHGTVLTAAGRLSLRRAENAADDSPLDPCCACSVCRRWSRAYLRHLLVVGEPAGGRLLTLHNLAWMVSFMDAIRAAISGGSLAALRDEVRAGWDTSVG
jgi:queuine tRNA-ribosyltransferase